MTRAYLQALIDRSAIEHNCRRLRACAGGRSMCVAIKANAYGHGVDRVLPVMDKCGIEMLGVACLEEACELRALGWKRPVLIFGSEFSAYTDEERRELAETIIEHEVRITLTRPQDLHVLSQAAERLRKTAGVHLDLDTGMCRMGLSEDDLWELIARLRTLPRITLEGIYTHFATADCKDKSFARRQLDRFNGFLDRLKAAGIEIPIVHAANSGACIDLPEAHFNMVRPGISTYGYHAGGEMHQKPDLRPALKLVSFLTLVKTIPAGSFVGYGCTFETRRETTIGLVPIGYADGYFRELSNRGTMIVAGRTVPVIGRVSMDQTIIDLTDLASQAGRPQAGDEVTIYDNRRESPNSVESIAALLNTIPYVVTTSLGRRVKRIAADQL
jgi:alanine racemase